jgi:D-alanyl-D-alanine carboxypeptidase
MLTTLLSLIAASNLAFQQPENTSSNLETPIVLTVPFPVKKPEAIAPVIQAKSYLTEDLETGQLLYSHNPDEKLPMASLTKLMLAKIILEENSLDEIVTVKKEATQVEPSKMNLLAGEKISVRDLMKGVMIKSANDAALALAIYNAGSVGAFVSKMNQEAQTMGLLNTHFQNPVGFDAPDHYSTASDLSILARTLYKKPFIQNVGPIKELQVQSSEGNFSHQLENTNELLNSYLKVLGLKTGTTDLAGQCLISIVENSNGNKILNVMLGSDTRFKETKILSQWIFDSFNWI